MKSNLLYIAMFLIILCMPLRGNEHEIIWLWADLLWVPLVLLLISLMCIAFYIYTKRIDNKIKTSK